MEQNRGFFYGSRLSDKLYPFHDFTFRDTQDEAAALMAGKRVCCLVFPTGQGKTLTSLLAYHRRKDSSVKRLICLVPKNAISSWEDDLEDYTFFDSSVYPEKFNPDAEVLIVPHSRITQFSATVPAIFWQESVVILDEVDSFINPETSLYLSAYRAVSEALVVWGLTASPIHNNLTNTYNFVNLMFSGISPFGTLYEFQGRFLQIRKRKIRLKGQIRTVNEVVGNKDLEGLSRILSTFCIFGTSKRDIRFRYTTCSLTPEEDEVYRRKGQEIVRGSPPTVLIHNLQKLVDGVKEGEELSSKEEHFCSLLPAFEKRSNPFIVFISYHDTRKRLLRILHERGIPTHEITGHTSSADRVKVKDKLWEGGLQCVLMTRAGIRGINLQCCESTLMYDIPTDVKDLTQLIGRQARIGSPFDTHYVIFMGVLTTIDEYKLHYVQSNIDTVRQLLEGSSTLPMLDKTYTKRQIIELRKTLIWRTRKA